MDADDALRRYLEQRLEMGESTIVLESMPAAEVRGLTSASIAAGTVTAEPSAAKPSKAEPTTPRTVVREAVPGPETSLPIPPSAGDTPGVPARMPEWRTALQASGAQPLAQKSDRARQSSAARVKAGTIPAGTAGRSLVDPDTPLPTLESLEAIAEMVAGCKRCALYATAMNPVPGEGNRNADFMVVGEAPGATEDETGRPFVGRAGNLLTQILEAIQLKREDVFICNVLKHRPPGNRNPEPGEVKACSPYLLRQIELIQPRVILALGTFAAQTLLNSKIPIGKLRGQIHEFHGVPLVVTYHPAALLRNPAWKRPTWEDVQLARRILDSAVPGA